MRRMKSQSGQQIGPNQAKKMSPGLFATIFYTHGFLPVLSVITYFSEPSESGKVHKLFYQITIYHFIPTVTKLVKCTKYMFTLYLRGLDLIQLVPY